MRFCALLLLAVSFAHAQKLPFDVHALFKLSRVSDPQVSPDGVWVAFTVQTIDLEKNSKPRQIWIVPVAGGEPHAITKDGTVNDRPRWTPDSKRLVYVSNRSGSSQIWAMDPTGGNSRQITNLSTEAAGVMVNPDGKGIVFTSDVFPDCNSDDCNKKKLDAEKANPVKARIYTTLLYRHWNEFEGARRRHILTMALDGGTARDLTPGTRHVPPFSLGGPDDYAVSPDGKELCFVMNPDADAATSTNAELFVVPMEGGDPKKIVINPGADNSPSYSPDGKWIAFRQQQRGGYEADRWRLMLLDRATGRTTSLTENLDRNVNGFAWQMDSKRVFFVTEDRGKTV
ncbi:MAG: PD40 domain-containing protein, partial [Candidatus Solibacter usitatus]|nr:PD40 domain-containing protein [Candidatus Solibacter usitatus]